MTASQQQEVRQGQRFEFGENWGRFLSVLNEQRIQLARQSVTRLLNVDSLAGKRFLDAGSGSGLFSLAARQLEAEVCSIDFDPQSVGCTQELKRRYFADDDRWQIHEGSVLDPNFLQALGKFDVVYSWGVLHHTGNMQQAFGNVANLVGDNGLLALSIYNDQGAWSHRWRRIKKVYCGLPSVLKTPFLYAVMLPRELKYLGIETLKLRPWRYFRHVSNYASQSLRGMSYWHDLRDWIGGYPFEVARPEDVFNFFHQRQFSLERLTTVGGGSGCNEFCFQKMSAHR